jgi:ubiquinone/menaquinone biosynthesis C-methylase UbiE
LSHGESEVLTALTSCFATSGGGDRASYRAVISRRQFRDCRLIIVTPANVDRLNDRDFQSQPPRYRKYEMTELRFQQGAAATYEQCLGTLSARLAPTVLSAARIGNGMRVLDVACGTGIVTRAAAALVRPAGHVIATDISAAMLDQARANLASLGNVSFDIQNAGALTFPDRCFEAVTCGLGIMFFPDPARSVAEFYRVLRDGGYAAISANPDAARTLVLRVLVAIDRHARGQTPRSGPVSFVGHEPRLRALFETAGFREVETAAETQTFQFPSFDNYFGAIERGAGIAGQEYLAQPPTIRAAVREDIRLGLNDNGGPITVPVDITFASGRR